MPTSVALRWFVQELRGLVMKLESAADSDPEFVDGEFGVSVRDHARELSESAVRFDELSDDEILRLGPSEVVRKAKRILRQMLESDEALSATLDDDARGLRKCLNVMPRVDVPIYVPSSDVVQEVVPAPPSNAKPIKRSSPKRRKPLIESSLTDKQVEAVHIVGECKGNIAEAARRLGKDRSTIKQHYDAGTAKLGKRAVKHSTKQHATDRRGQANIATDSDKRL